MHRIPNRGIAFGFSLIIASSAFGQVVINEVLQNPEGSNDDVWEYIELYGRPGMDLSGYAIAAVKGGRDLNANGTFDPGEEVPEIDEAFSLDGLSLGADGFLILYNNTLGFSNLVDLNLISPTATAAGFIATHIPTTDTPGKLGNDGSSTYLLVRKRFDHTLDSNRQSVYGPDYAFRKDIRHDVNADGDTDFGTEVNVLNTGEPTRRVDPYQMVDEVSFSHENGREYHRDNESQISETSGFNPDMVTRLHYYLQNPQLGHRTTGPSAGPFTISQTTTADESFLYGDEASSAPANANFLKFSTAIDGPSGYIKSKAPTDTSAMPYDGACDPEPDNLNNPACLPNAGGTYRFKDMDVTGMKLTPGAFNDHPTNTALRQFRFIRGDFNVDGQVNNDDQLLILARTGRTLDETEPAQYDPTPDDPDNGDTVSYSRYLQQGVEFQLVAMMRDMDLDDGPGGANADPITQDDIDAFLAECALCTPQCASCPGDADGSADVNMGDVSVFVECALGNTPAGQCLCSDMNADDILDGRDVGLFANTLITNPGSCP